MDGNLLYRKHWDAGLMGIDGGSLVNVALQALLHVPELVTVVEDDNLHRQQCRSILKCMPCALHRLVECMKRTGMADPSYFINLWRTLSCQMDPHLQNDHYVVLTIFISKLRLAYLERNPDFSVEDYYRSPVGTCFEGNKIVRVHCEICGSKKLSKPLGSIKITQEQISGEAVERNLLVNESNPLCKFCKMETNSVTFPPYFIVSSDILCSPSFRLPLALSVFGEKMKFHSCLVQSSEKITFISLCVDGSVRQFNNEKISNLSFGKLASSSEIFEGSALTIIYKTEQEPIRTSIKQTPSKIPTIIYKTKQEPTQTTIRTVVRHPCKLIKQQTHSKIPILKQTSISTQHFTVVSMPDMDCDLYRDLPEPPKTRTIGTQTEKASIVESCSQTECLEEPLISFEKCKEDEKFQFFTGLNPMDFEALHDFIGGEDLINQLKLKYNSTHDSTPPKRRVKPMLSSRDKLFMFLLRLRRGLPLEELAFIFKVSVSHVSEICYAMTRLIYETFRGVKDIVFISAAQQAKKKPLVMKPFKNLRVILDGASFFIEMPTNFQMQGNTYSEYKSHNVLLFIVGVSCQGSTIFCSKGFEGNMSDKCAILSSPEFLEKLDKGDAIMVDRGFDVTAELLKKGVHVIKPPPKGDSGHLNSSEELLTKAVAAARIYVEHAIADMKDNRLLQGTIPLTLLPVLPQLVYIAAFLRNFSTKKIMNKKFRVVPEVSK